MSREIVSALKRTAIFLAGFDSTEPIIILDFLRMAVADPPFKLMYTNDHIPKSAGVFPLARCLIFDAH